jgi:autotransporter-associated beta strand protein
MLACLALSLVVGGFAPASAAERVWDGGAPVNIGWTDAANWVTRGLTPTAPAAGDDLRFPAGALKPSNNNNFPVGTSFNLLTYAGAGYTVSGNEIGLTGGIVVSHGEGNTVLNLPINIALNQTFMVSVAGANLFLNGAVDLVGTRPVLIFDGAGQTVVVGNISDSRVGFGGGTIRKNGVGTLYVLQNLTFGGPTIVNEGTLIMDGRTSNSAVTVNASATLRGTGKVGGLTVNSGGTVSPGQNSPDVLDSLGDVALTADSTFNVRLNGTSVGLNYDQLKVQGAVTLGGTLNVTAGFTAAVGDTFTIIDNDGDDDVVGTFAGLPERAILMINGRPFQISYGGRGTIGGGLGRDVNDVTLEAVPALRVWDGEGGGNNLWSLPLNWVGDVLPMPGDDIQFHHTNSGPLITRNDFPAGSVFGSMLLGGHTHEVQGNLAQLNGPIEITESGSFNILAPLVMAGGIRHAIQFGNLSLRGAITLSANQAFWLGHPNASLSIYGNIALNGHNLTVDTVARPQFRGFVGAPGGMIKRGTNELVLWGTNNCAVAVEEGTFSIKPNGLVVGPLVVKAGAELNAEGNLHDMEVQSGGIFTPEFPTVNGTVRLLTGSVLKIEIFEIGSGTNQTATSTAFAVGTNGSLEISGATLAVNIQSGTTIEPGDSFTIISTKPWNSPVPVTGAFGGLPEGGVFVADGRAFSITYAANSSGPRVILYADPNFIWDGGGTGGNWNTAANWQAGIVPPSRVPLLFPAGVSKRVVTNDLVGAFFRSLIFQDDYVVHGNGFATESVSCTMSNEVIIHSDISGPFNEEAGLFVGTSGRLRLEGVVSGQWRKIGSGTLRLGGTDGNLGLSINVGDGDLELAKVGAIAVSSSLSVGLNMPSTVTLLEDDQIGDSSGVGVYSGSRFELNGNTDVIGGLSGSGTVALSERLQRFGRLTVGHGNFSGTIIGSGTLTKTTSPFGSTLVLTGPNTFSGPTILAGGELQVEGTQTNSPVRLDGGTLSGRGWVGTITANLGGAIAPGSGPPALDVALHSRDVALNPASTFRPRLDSILIGFETQPLSVVGAVSLGGSVLSVEVYQNFAPPSGARFVIIRNDGTDPVAGTFNGLFEGAEFVGDILPFRISYVGGDGNDVELTRIGAPSSILNPLVTFNETQVTIRGRGLSGVTYLIQGTTNLAPLIYWTPLGLATADRNGDFEFYGYPGGVGPLPPTYFFRAVSP